MDRPPRPGDYPDCEAIFSDDATIAASLAGVRAGIQRAYDNLEELERQQ